MADAKKVTPKSKRLGDPVESVDITFVLDRSGSMAGLVSEVISGFNSFVAEQKKLPGSAVLTTILFDTSYDVLYSGKDLNDVPVLDSKTYYARGTTALFDAVARGIGEAESRVEQTNPDKVLFIVFTDGYENSSREVRSKDDLKKIIDAHPEWDFLYFGANQDAFAEGGGMGIARSTTTNMQNDPVGTTAAYFSANRYATEVRTGGGFVPDLTSIYNEADAGLRTGDAPADNTPEE